MVVHLYDSDLKEVNFFHGRLVRDDVLALRDLARVHRHYELIYKASLTLVEECIKGLFELIKCLGLFDQLSLHFRSHLLIKRKFFDQKVKILLESLLNVESDIVI